MYPLFAAFALLILPQSAAAEIAQPTQPAGVVIYNEDGTREGVGSNYRPPRLVLPEEQVKRVTVQTRLDDPATPEDESKMLLDDPATPEDESKLLLDDPATPQDESKPAVPPVAAPAPAPAPPRLRSDSNTGLRSDRNMMNRTTNGR